MIKKSELPKLLEDGHMMCLGMYWNGRIEAISVRANQQGGPRRTAYIAQETVMRDSGPMLVTRFLRDDEDHTKWKPAAEKMKQVLVTIQKVEVQNGVPRITGTVEPISA